MSELQCIVVTPEQTVCDQPADFVALTLFDGEVGIAPGHTPLIGRLGFGEMRIKRNSETVRYYIEGGFVEVIDDVISVLTERALPPEKIDERKARDEIAAAAARRATTPELMELRDREAAQGRAQLRVAQHGQ